MLAGWESILERLGLQGSGLAAAALVPNSDLSQLLGRSLDGGATGADRARAVVEWLTEHPDSGPRLLAVLDEVSGSNADKIEEPNAREELAACIRTPELTAGRLLFRLARPARAALPPAELRAASEVIASAVLGEDTGSRPKWLARSAADRAGLREWEQDRRELEARVRHLEAQQGRLLERSAELEKQLARRVAEVQELRLGDKATREERIRLEREVTRLEKRIQELNERRARENTGVLTTALRRLTTEQRRAASTLEKVRKALTEKREALRDQARRLGTLEQVVEKLLTLRDVDSRAWAATQEAILRRLEEAPGTYGAESRPAAEPPRPRTVPDEPRVGLFVDVQNMFYGAREKGARLDFEALLAEASTNRRLVRAVAYLVETRDIDQSAFIHLLEVKRYEVRRKPLRIRPDGSMKGNWDLEIALDVLTTADNLDVVVLVTGDGDFLPLVRMLKLRGLAVEVFGFPRSSAPDLREAADRFVPITRRMLRPLSPERRPRSTASRPAPANGDPPPPEPTAAAPAEPESASGLAMEDEPAPAAPAT